VHTGVDMSYSNTAIVSLGSGGQIEHKTNFGSHYNESLKRAKKYHPAQRLYMHNQFFEDYLTSFPIFGTLIIESPFVGFRGSYNLLELKGVLLCTAYKYCRANKIFLVAPRSIKKAFTGTGAATKKDMVAECIRRGYDPKTHDEADAIAAALMGHENTIWNHLNRKYEYT